MTILVITSCGHRKAEQRMRADRLYVGRYYTACMRYARELAPVDRIRILSAKHGLLPLDRQVDPYNLKFGMPGAVTLDVLRRQAAEQGLLDADPVTVLGGVAYSRLCLQVWPHATTPLVGLPGRMGGQLSALDRWARHLQSERKAASVQDQ